MRLNRPLTAALAVLGLGLASPTPAMAGPPHADPPRAGHGPGRPGHAPDATGAEDQGGPDVLQQRARPDALPGLEHLLRPRWRPHRGRGTVGHRPDGQQWPARRRLHLRLDRRQLGRAHPAQRGRSARRRPGPLPRWDGRAGRVHPQQGDEGRHLHRRRPVPAGAVRARQQRCTTGRDVAQFAGWGFDALKADWLCGRAAGLDPEATFRELAEAVRQSPRPMLLNICNPVSSDWGGGPYTPEQLSTWSYTYAPTIADSWRTYTDVGLTDPTPAVGVPVGAAQHGRQRVPPGGHRAGALQRPGLPAADAPAARRRVRVEPGRVQDAARQCGPSWPRRW